MVLLRVDVSCWGIMRVVLVIRAYTQKNRRFDSCVVLVRIVFRLFAGPFLPQQKRKEVV